MKRNTPISFVSLSSNSFFLFLSLSLSFPSSFLPFYFSSAFLFLMRYFGSLRKCAEVCGRDCVQLIGLVIPIRNKCLWLWKKKRRKDEQTFHYGIWENFLRRAIFSAEQSVFLRSLLPLGNFAVPSWESSPYSYECKTKYNSQPFKKEGEKERRKRKKIKSLEKRNWGNFFVVFFSSSSFCSSSGSSCSSSCCCSSCSSSYRVCIRGNDFHFEIVEIAHHLRCTNTNF